MAADQTPRARDGTDAEHAPPELSVCESAPGRRVFIESGNADGWISSDVTLDVEE